jgi:hypothetical protein
VHQGSVRITRVRAARDVQRQRLPVLPLCAIGDHQGLAIATLAEGCWMRPDVSGDSGFEASDEDCVSAAGGCSGGTLDFNFFVGNGLAEFLKPSQWL